MKKIFLDIAQNRQPLITFIHLESRYNILLDATLLFYYFPFSAEELIPRREPKYEIIVEKEEKVTVIEDVNVPEVDREQAKTLNKEPQSDVRKRKKQSKQKSEERKHRQRIRLLGGGTSTVAGAEILLYLSVFTVGTHIFFI